MKQNWTRIIETKINKFEVENKIDEIGRCIYTNNNTLNNIGPHTGLSCVAIFCFYYYKITGYKKFYNLGLSLCKRAFGYLLKKNSFSFCNGIPGLFWTIEFLNKEGITDFEISDYKKAFDKSLIDSMKLESPDICMDVTDTGNKVQVEIWDGPDVLV